ncbi:MAG: PilZ domain-containing protein [Desulfobacterales bacterium]|nr:PilZ domain-containing protein [Desulfobacterales bacterium]
MDFTEKRKHKRIPIEVAAEIELPDGKIYKGKTENLCFGGAFVSLTEEFNKQNIENCNLKLILKESNNQIDIKFKCDIVHIQKDETGIGIGIKFKSIDGDSYHYFKKLMVLNSSEPEDLLEELQQSPGIII